MMHDALCVMIRDDNEQYVNDSHCGNVSCNQNIEYHSLPVIIIQLLKNSLFKGL